VTPTDLLARIRQPRPNVASRRLSSYRSAGARADRPDPHRWGQGRQIHA